MSWPRPPIMALIYRWVGSTATKATLRLCEADSRLCSNQADILKIRSGCLHIQIQ
ncbi:MAG: hypothetical protein ACLRXQ_12035 [Phascolarctobacterium faecium]